MDDLNRSNYDKSSVWGFGHFLDPGPEIEMHKCLICDKEFENLEKHSLGLQ